MRETSPAAKIEEKRMLLQARVSMIKKYLPYYIAGSFTLLRKPPYHVVALALSQKS